MLTDIEAHPASPAHLEVNLSQVHGFEAQRFALTSRQLAHFIFY
jgi:hypothetical protein